jgi:hypothetical protein
MVKIRRIGLPELVSACLFFAVTASGQTPGTQPAPATAAPSSAMHASARAVATPQHAVASAAIKGVRVLGGKNAIEIEVEGSERLTPQTKVLTGPDRLVIDFPNAAPAAQVRNQQVNRGEVKDIRVGLFQTSPPVTRIVLDLKSAQSCQIFPDGKTVIIKISGKNQSAAQGVDDFPPAPVTRPGLLSTNYTPGTARVSTSPAPPEPVLDVTFRNGMLSIKSTRASLSDILFAVHQRTGANVTLSAGAEQEKVAADLGPAPAPEVLARLLNGSKFNFLIVSSASDARVLDKVILSPKAEGAITPLPPMANMANDDQVDESPALPPTPRRVEPADNPSVNNAPAPNGPPTNMPPPRGGSQMPPGAQQPPSDETNTPD